MGFMEASKDDGTFNNIIVASFSGCWLGQVSWVYHIHEFLKPVIGNWLGINMRHGGLRDFAMRETASRSKRPVEKRDMVGRFFETNAQKPEEFPYNSVISMATTNVMAGSDTTAVSMRAIIYHILKNSEAKRKLVEEIDDLRKRGELSDPVRFDEAMKMKYLQAAIYEGLRVHPAVGMNLPRIVPSGGAQICGHYIPAGNVVGVNAWAVHQNRDVYGEDADQFRPERWLKGDTGDMRKSQKSELHLPATYFPSMASANISRTSTILFLFRCWFQSLHRPEHQLARDVQGKCALPILSTSS